MDPLGSMLAAARYATIQIICRTGTRYITQQATSIPALPDSTSVITALGGKLKKGELDERTVYL